MRARTRAKDARGRAARRSAARTRRPRAPPARRSPRRAPRSSQLERAAEVVGDRVEDRQARIGAHRGELVGDSVQQGKRRGRPLDLRDELDQPERTQVERRSGCPSGGFSTPASMLLNVRSRRATVSDVVKIFWVSGRFVGEGVA
jgi:hypothetical protein